MNVVVNKQALLQALVETLASDEPAPEFDRISIEGDEPITPSEVMSTQLSEEMPPVGDEDFIPSSLEELARSAFVIAKETPPDEIEYFYRKLHELLDSAIDRDNEKNLKVESFEKIISGMLSESSDIRSALVRKMSDRVSSGEIDSYSAAVELIDMYSEFDDDEAEEVQMEIEAIGMEQFEPAKSDDATSPEVSSRPSASPKNVKPDAEDNSDADEFKYSDEDYESDLGKESSEQSAESIASDIVDLIMKKGLHTTVLRDPETGNAEMVPVVIIDPKTGDFKLSEKEMRVLASESYGFEVIKTALAMSDISELFDRLKSVAGSDKAAYLWLYSNLSEILGKEGNPVSSELGAEMYANQIADTIGKYGESVRDQLIAMADQVEAKTEDIATQIGRGSDSLSIVVPPGEMATALRMVAGQRLEAPKRGRPRLYDEDEPREAMTPEMRKQIRAERRKAELELEYEPGKMHLSPKALRAMMDDIATGLGVSLGNVRNVIYDDLKVYGLPAEDLRKMVQVDKLPGGREKIPFTYDPLRVQAKEKIVEKLYDMYRVAMMSYIEEVASSGEEEDRDIAEAYSDLFFSDGGFYQPGLDGYVALQGQVGGPTLDDPDSVDVDDAAFRTKRKAYDFVQEFIDQVAKEWLDPDSPEYKQAKEGGMRAFLNSLVNDETFSDVNSRADIDKVIDKEVNAIESNFDEDKLKEIIDIVFDKAPKRTKKYIARIKKELGSGK